MVGTSERQNVNSKRKTIWRNQSVYKSGVYARSHAAPTTNPWSINMTEKGGVYDIINDTTKGIWLSYQKHTIKSMKNGIRIIELVKTGEQFLVKKNKKERL